MTQGRSQSARDDRLGKVPLQEQISGTQEKDGRQRVLANRSQNALRLRSAQPAPRPIALSPYAASDSAIRGCHLFFSVLFSPTNRATAW